jgi:acyl carrier protein
MADDAQKLRIKNMLVEHLHLRMEADSIGDTAPLFGDEGLGLDSVDAIEMVAGIEQEFGYTFASEDEAREVLKDVDTLAAFLEGKGALG